MDSDPGPGPHTEGQSEEWKKAHLRESLETQLKRLICEHLGVDLEKVVDTANLQDDLGADSLDVVELVMVFEEELRIEITDAETDKLYLPETKFSDIHKMIEGKLTAPVA